MDADSLPNDGSGLRPTRAQRRRYPRRRVSTGSAHLGRALPAALGRGGLGRAHPRRRRTGEAAMRADRQEAA